MNALIKYQGRVFIVVSVALMVSVALGLNLADERYIPVIGALVVLLGMPHGAFDVVYAQRLLVLKTWRHWSLFVLGYVSLALAVIGLWWLAPTVFLVGFLLMSAYHFADDLPQGVRFLSRLAYGGSSIVLPALLHSAELTRLLGWVAGGPSALWVVPLLQQLAGIWLVITLCLVVMEAWHHPAAALELGALTTISVLAPPLVAFTVFFCLMHSPRHLLRTLAAVSIVERTRAVWLAVGPTVLTFVVLGLGVYVFRDEPLSARVMQLVFVSLAALTLPHMLLLNRVGRLAVYK